MIIVGHAGGRTASVSFDFSELGPPDTPADEDLLLNVTVTVGGYAATDQVWILKEQFDDFLEDLSELERERRGRAELEAASRDEFVMTIRSTDAAGHLAVEGHVGDRTPDGFILALQFGFALDPGLLAQVLRDARALRPR